MTEPVLEVRTYKLVDGAGPRFHQLFLHEALPLLTEHGVTVVHAGPSLVDQDQYVLIRGFASPADRAEKSDAFYGSDGWLAGLEERVLACIDSYHTVVVPWSSIAGAVEPPR